MLEDKKLLGLLIRDNLLHAECLLSNTNLRILLHIYSRSIILSDQLSNVITDHLQCRLNNFLMEICKRLTEVSPNIKN